MFPISDENERGHGPAYVSLLFIALNVLVFIVPRHPRGTPASQFR